MNKKKLSEKDEPVHGKLKKYVGEITKLELGNQIFEMLIKGHTVDEIREKLNCTENTIAEYLDLKLQERQDMFMNLRGKFVIVTHERIEKYLINPIIRRIEKSIEADRFDERAFSLLMKAIKLEAELLAPKTVFSMQTNANTIFMTSGGEFYNSVVSMMRSDPIYQQPDVVQGESVMPQIEAIIDKIPEEKEE